MILGKGQVTSTDLFVTATQCLDSLKTEPALQTWTSSRLRALHPGHVGCKQFPA